MLRLSRSSLNNRPSIVEMKKQFATRSRAVRQSSLVILISPTRVAALVGMISATLRLTIHQKHSSQSSGSRHSGVTAGSSPPHLPQERALCAPHKAKWPTVMDGNGEQWNSESHRMPPMTRTGHPRYRLEYRFDASSYRCVRAAKREED